MERFAAMVSSRRAAPAPAPAPAAAAAPGPDEEEVKEKAKEKRKLMAEDEAYLRIQLEEIVVVKNEDVTRLAAAHGTNYLGGGATSRACAPGAAAAAGPAGSSTGTAAAARGALSTTVGWIVGSN